MMAQAAEYRARVERFENLWKANYADVFSYVQRRIGDSNAADDVVADTFAIAWRRLDSVPCPPRAWLLGVARRVLANDRRGIRRRDALLAKVSHRPDRSVTGDPDEDSARTAAVAAAFNELSVRDREVLSLVVWQELKPGEAADVFGVSSARFSVWLHRAKARLRRRLEAQQRQVQHPPPPPNAAVVPTNIESETP
jgi:RNA polymerase sigma-70 factor (ECF subfamily)